MTTFLEDAQAIADSAKATATQVGMLLNDHVPSEGLPELSAEETHSALAHLTVATQNAAFAIEKLIEHVETTTRRRWFNLRK